MFAFKYSYQTGTTVGPYYYITKMYTPAEEDQFSRLFEYQVGDEGEESDERYEGYVIEITVTRTDDRNITEVPNTRTGEES